MDEIQKLQRFVEAALTNPQHPIYRLGMQQSPILQHYAVNVSLLHSVKPEDWFKQYPEHTAKLTEVMKLCEDEQKAGEQEQSELDAVKAELAALKAQLAKTAKPEPREDEDQDDEEAPESQEA